MARYEETVTADQVGKISWQEELFKYCRFRDFELSVVEVDSDFILCTFENLDWYGGLFNLCNFVECRFQGCVFRGSTFAGCKFVQCTFEDCRFEDDNMGSACTFDDSVFYDTVISGSAGVPEIA